LIYSFLAADNVFPTQLVAGGNRTSTTLVPLTPLGNPDPGAASGGYDGIYQFTNQNCFNLVQAQLPLTFQVTSIDGQAASALNSLQLQPPLASYFGGRQPAGLSIVLKFEPMDLLFTTEQTTCYIEYSLIAALAVVAPTGSQQAASITPKLINPLTGQLIKGSSYVDVLPLNFPDGASSVAGVLAYLASGTLRIPATYAVEVDATQATIDTNAAIDLAQIEVIHTSGSLPNLVFQSDPLGLLATLRASLAPYQTVALIPEICPLGLNAGSTSLFATFEANVFPTGLPTTPTATSLTVALTVSPAIGNPADVPDLVSNVDYAVVASEQILNGLVMQRWLINDFPKKFPSSGQIQVTSNGQVTNATVTGSFNLLSLDTVAIDYNSNARIDVIVIAGTGREFPASVVLSNGTVITQSGPNDPLFQPGNLQNWTFAGPLVTAFTSAQEAAAVVNQDVTSSVTVYLGRPFTGEISAKVTLASVSAPSQRILLLAELQADLTAASV
jgi:hypothetical protein